jgi:hypothetical protein
MQMKLLGTTNAAFDIIGQRQILEKKWECNGTVHQLFIDFKEAYDSVRREDYATFSLSLEYPGNWWG